MTTRREHRRLTNLGASQSELPIANNQENVPQRAEASQVTLTDKQQAKAAAAAEQLEKEQKECGSRFKLIEKIGEGTYGVVFKAIDQKLNQVSISSFSDTELIHVCANISDLQAFKQSHAGVEFSLCSHERKRPNKFYLLQPFALNFVRFISPVELHCKC